MRDLESIIQPPLTSFLFGINCAVSLADQSIELHYQRLIGAMPTFERVARSAAMFQWTREQIARQIAAELGRPIDGERMKWLIGLRLYGREPAVRELIERELERHVSD